MGQQQLLLLVLSTVIVGLATVAGIQAFSENQAQAAQDALVQRGTSIMSDVQGLAGKPTQMGGVNLPGATPSTVFDRLGYDTPSSDSQTPVEGASGTSNCVLETTSSNIDASVNSNAAVAEVECIAANADQDVRVALGGGGDISTSFGDYR
ncbi:hypothetical protein GGP85_002845 [Salinibacter ruber]|jgi:hypothetical protein|uniref:hypothetical protein n=1 Tax=Salinibacter ruber TaxID=146919 RepID=UPI002166C396|nr:hypothetical protein [Salinibacter ruber]MCS3628899.1 hypothetical protein [Salinibacter ruber]MCS3667106.1 hypothetical protein [Salinibacter ruber]MCS3697590.1 hypothetical protein [Salinibacter ruber]MCS3827376.1 hypothetical protein [Salinibacter ruber]MCS4145808.1 hypothetical protein [Salinibacter ruber]